MTADSCTDVSVDVLVQLNFLDRKTFRPREEGGSLVGTANIYKRGKQTIALIPELIKGCAEIYSPIKSTCCDVDSQRQN